MHTRLFFVLGLVVLTALECDARDLVIKSPRVTSAAPFNSTCNEFYHPTMELCPDCTARKTTFTVEPYFTDRSQRIVELVGGTTPNDTAIVIDNTGTKGIEIFATANGYTLCATGGETLDGVSIASEYTLTLFPSPLPAALPVAQTWTLSENLAAFVQVDGVVASTAACIGAGPNTATSECMQLCAAMDTCTYFVKTGTACDLCTDVTIAQHTWILDTGGASVFLRGKHLHLFAKDATFGLAVQRSAFPTHQVTLDYMFATVSAFALAIIAYMGIYLEIGWKTTAAYREDSIVADEIELVAQSTATPPAKAPNITTASNFQHETDALLSSQTHPGTNTAVYHHRNGITTASSPTGSPVQVDAPVVFDDL